MKKFLKKLKQKWCALRNHDTDAGFTVRQEGDWLVMTCEACDAEFWHER